MRRVVVSHCEEPGQPLRDSLGHGTDVAGIVANVTHAFAAVERT